MTSGPAPWFAARQMSDLWDAGIVFAFGFTGGIAAGLLTAYFVSVFT